MVKYKVRYVDGTNGEIDLDRMAMYDLDYKGIFIPKGINVDFKSVGFDLGDLLNYLKDNKPIVIVKKEENSKVAKIERIINSCTIKDLEPLN